MICTTYCNTMHLYHNNICDWTCETFFALHTFNSSTLGTYITQYHNFMILIFSHIILNNVSAVAIRFQVNTLTDFTVVVLLLIVLQCRSKIGCVEMEGFCKAGHIHSSVILMSVLILTNHYSSVLGCININILIPLVYASCKVM